MLVAFIILMLLFLLLSVLAFMGRLTSFIAGKSVQNNTENLYDEKGAGNFIGIIMSLLMISCAVGMLGFAAEGLRWLILAAPIVFILLLIFAIVFINTNNRFEAPADELEEDK